MFAEIQTPYSEVRGSENAEGEASEWEVQKTSGTIHNSSLRLDLQFQKPVFKDSRCGLKLTDKFPEFRSYPVLCVFVFSAVVVVGEKLIILEVDSGWIIY